MSSKTVPYRCLKCMQPGACGYHGLLVFPNQDPPMCDHNEGPKKPCHEKPEQMVPVKP